jgi:hypothetical protein
LKTSVAMLGHRYASPACDYDHHDPITRHYHPRSISL